MRYGAKCLRIAETCLILWITAFKAYLNGLFKNINSFIYFIRNEMSNLELERFVEYDLLMENILIGRSLYMVENNFPTDFSNFMAAFITNMMLS
ncbi:hypothetical protein T03_9837 [Trichinella britovi]|uniref:Uncharacterized protein n=1 Tax=Trichinella britovi TaxID=45882 RepID=A0A0V1CCP1_TRIBR|nr:hypothetical protein T03_9837 [Trichinella britovi]